jgi:hypothetical protein
MNVNYTYKLKCPDSDHGETDIWDVLSEKPSRTYYCHGHKITLPYSVQNLVVNPVTTCEFSICDKIIL